MIQMACGLVVATLLVALFQDSADRLNPGTILVATEKLNDPNFAETVVLIVHHDDDGGIMGVVLNRPMDVTLAKAFPQMHGSSDPVYDGGPVSPDALQALLRTSEKPDKAERLFADIYSVIHKTLLEKSINDRLPSSRFRVFLGYAGWGPGQLENEVRLGAWLPLHGTPKYVFDADPLTLWDRLNRESHTQVAQNSKPGTARMFPRFLRHLPHHATIKACCCSAPPSSPYSSPPPPSPNLPPYSFSASKTIPPTLKSIGSAKASPKPSAQNSPKPTKSFSTAPPPSPA